MNERSREQSCTAHWQCAETFYDHLIHYKRGTGHFERDGNNYFVYVYLLRLDNADLGSKKLKLEYRTQLTHNTEANISFNTPNGTVHFWGGERSKAKQIKARNVKIRKLRNYHQQEAALCRKSAQDQRLCTATQLSWSLSLCMYV